MEANSCVGVGTDLSVRGLPDHLFAAVAADGRCRPAASAACNRIAVPCRCWRAEHFWVRMT